MYNLSKNKLSEHTISRAITAVTQEHINGYQLYGAVFFKQLLRDHEINLLEHGIEENLKNLSPRAKIASKKNDTGLFIEDFCTWQNNPFYQRFIFETPISVVAALLMQSRISRLYHDHLLVKEKETQQDTPWHQDQPYYNIEGRQNCSFWIPVDIIPRQYTLEFISGSHLGPWLMPRTFIDNEAKWFPEGTLSELPNIEENRKAYPIIGWEMEPGDVVSFHMLTLHAASGAKQRRRVFSLRFLGDDITHAPRTWKTSPDFSNLITDIPADEPLNHPLFPIIWQRHHI
jgi:ectoine hydroxylase-related dioxygenase (phytanoyl-CoA dioxygenase family)